MLIQVTEKGTKCVQGGGQVEMKDSSDAGNAPSENESKASQAKDELEE
jgi:hypothetical protein